MKSFSTLRIETFPQGLIQGIKNHFTVRIPGYQFMPKYKLGIWDGKITFLKGNELPIGLLDELKLLADTKDYKFTLHSLEENVKFELTEVVLEKFVDSLNIPWDLYDYQFEGVLEAFNNKRINIHSKTGSGKSLMQYVLIRLFLQLGLKVLLVVPTVDLVTQMFEDFEDYGWDDIHEHTKMIFGGVKNRSLDKQLTISTWQTLDSILSGRGNGGKEKKENMEESLTEMDCLMIDECLDGNSLISMSDGSFKKIKDVKAGDRVLTINEDTKELDNNVVVKTHINIPSSEMYEIETEEGTIRITGNHKVNTTNGWIRVDELTLEDELIGID